jgi:hypothetical protein
MRPAAILLSAFAIAAPIPAAADELPGSRFASGHWAGAAYDKNRAFSHCAMSAGYRSGISMLFSVSENWTWRVGWMHKDWKLPVGQNIPITYWIDGFPPRQLVARAQSATLAFAELPAQVEVFDLFRKGYVLYVQAEGQRYQFNLEGTYAALTTLGECVKRYRTVAQTPPQPSLPKASAEQRLEATQVVANIVARSDVGDVRILSDGEVQRLGVAYLQSADVVWQAPGLLGLLRILPKGSVANTDEAASTILADDGRACKGTFVSGFTDDALTGSAKRMFSACETSLNSNVFRYTLVPWVDGSIWMFVTTGRQGAQADRQAIDKAEVGLRKAVYDVAGR